MLSDELTALIRRDLDAAIELPPRQHWRPAPPAKRPRRSWTFALVVAVVLLAFAVIVAGPLLAGREQRLTPSKSVGLVASPTNAQFARFELSGTVTDASNGRPLQGIRAYVVPVEACCRTFDAVGTTLTDSAGNYSVEVLRGRYRVVFIASRSGQANICTRPSPCGPDPVATVPYEPLWWPRGTGQAQGDEIVVDQDRAGVDAALRAVHEITGSFVFNGKPVRAFIFVARAKERDVVVIATTNADGTFRVPVPDGAYYLEFAPHDAGPTGGSWPADIVVEGTDVVNINRVEP